MKRIIICGLLVALVLSCAGCAIEILSSTTGYGRPLAYEVKSVRDDNSYENCEIMYPLLSGDLEDIDVVNQLIWDALDARLAVIVQNSTPESSCRFAYSLTCSSNEVVCVLFEGVLSDSQAAHPTNVAFAVTVSLQEKRLIDHSELITLDSGLIKALRESLTLGDRSGRFTVEQWSMVAEYINSFSDDEIAEQLRTDFNATTAIEENGVLILYPVPRAIGDYVKISVAEDRRRIAQGIARGQGDGSVVPLSHVPGSRRCFSGRKEQ